MPSPLGHALGAVAAGWLASGRETPWRRAVPAAIAFAAVGVAPDLDLLLAGAHRGPSHGIGAAALAGLAAYAATRRGRLAGGVAAAYGSHILLDWLGSDTTPPIGLMALWPIGREYYQSTLHVFGAISRRYWLPEFWVLNTRALLREVLILLPLAAFAAHVRRRTR